MMHIRSDANDMRIEKHRNNKMLCSTTHETRTLNVRAEKQINVKIKHENKQANKKLILIHL